MARPHHIGYFGSELEAAVAYDQVVIITQSLQRKTNFDRSFYVVSKLFTFGILSVCERMGAAFLCKRVSIHFLLRTGNSIG